MSNPQYPQNQQPNWQPQHAAPAPAKKGGKLVVLAVSAAAVGGLFFGCLGGNAIGRSGTAEPGATVTVTAPAEKAPAKPEPKETKKAEPKPEETEEPKEEEPPAAVLSDGMWEVGVDVKPGRYKTTVPDDSFNCYWARHKDDSGEFRSIIANGNHDAGERVSITIKKGEFLELNGCGDSWKRVS